eukprot:4528264-Pyramimonas_sp.AAC.1
MSSRSAMTATARQKISFKRGADDEPAVAKVLADDPSKGRLDVCRRAREPAREADREQGRDELLEAKYVFYFAVQDVRSAMPIHKYYHAQYSLAPLGLNIVDLSPPDELELGLLSSAAQIAADEQDNYLAALGELDDALEGERRIRLLQRREDRGRIPAAKETWR